MIPTNRLEQYNQVVDNIKNRSNYYYLQHPLKWDELFQYLEGERDDFTADPSVFENYSFSNIYTLLSRPNNWDEFDDRIMHVLLSFWKHPKIHHCYYLSKERLLEYLRHYLSSSTNINEVRKMGYILAKYGIDEVFFATRLFDYAYAYSNGEVTPIGQYIVENIDGIFSQMPIIEHNLVFRALLATDEQILDKYLNKLIVPNEANEIRGFYNIINLLAHNPKKYEAFIVDVLRNTSHKTQILRILFMLETHFPQKYNMEIVESGYEYLDALKASFSNANFRFEWGGTGKPIERNYFINAVFASLFDKEPFEKVFSTVKNFLNQCPYTCAGIIEFLYDYIGDKSIPILAESLGKTDPVYLNTDEIILERLQKHNHEEFYPKIWALLAKTNKKTRVVIAHHLVTVMGEAAIPNAQKLLDDKKGDIRLAGALILSLIKTEKSTAILRGLLNSEKNDDARDAMLEGLGDLINAEANRETVQDAIHQAKNRGKLDKPLMAWLVSSDFTPLYEQSGDPLSKEAVDFLFYRMNRTKDIRIDAEAKPLLAQIDKSKSAPFAKVLLKKYFENGADAKLKWCMTLGSILGSDDEMDTIKRKVNEWAEASRGKMAEYAVKALALNGSTKALRAVEFFSRKYKSKNKNIGAAAIESFSIAAEELGITPYDLADSIIPDFGFDGLFKEFEAEGETYRAFINNDFKLAFLNEDNRLLKALPKGTSAALKEEFKEIGKEVRDIVKSQSSRLEQYLVIQRKWSVEKWDTFFRGNPIMFAYAVRVIWAIFDEKQQIITTFQCLEDQTLVNVDGDELDLDDYTEGYQIGMVHPIDLTQETINHWKQALADADVQPIFPQLDRPVIAFKESDRHLTLSNEFNGIQYGGYGFVSKMEKLGWFRGSVVDAGGISSYYKDFSELGITAIIMQNGCIGVGYYEENAELGDLMFVRPKSVKFGSYSYNEPNKREDERLIPFGEVPQIVYSEVMADMLFFKENQIKKEEK